MRKNTTFRLWRLLAFTLALAVVLLAVGPSLAVSAQGAQPVGCVTAYRLNIRSGPGITYPVISGLSLDQCVTLAGYRNAESTWLQIRLPSGGTGWVSATYITTTYPLASLAVAQGPSANTPTQPPVGAWRGEYYSNGGLGGTPALVRNDAAISFDWGLGAAAAGLPADYFSVRWTRAAEFEGATYRFQAVVDDGVRLWVDGQLIIDAWHDGAARQFVADYALSPGFHNMRVEYYERAGFASSRVWWERLWPTTSYPNWKGEYFANSSLAGTPALVRNDTNVEFNWGFGAAAGGLPGDNFSSRWTRTADFEEGTYRFHAVVDDGVRLWADDQRIIDAWWDGGAREHVADYALGAGPHSLRVEYYERTGLAEIRVWWEKITSLPAWKGEYFTNRKVQGSPAVVRNDSKIDFNWKEGIPVDGLPKDNFSVRWTRTRDFDAATYRVTARVDDGVRVWIDGQLVIDSWQDGELRELTADRPMVKGKHTVRVEYYDRTGKAQVRVSLDKITPTFAEWKGQYWSNRDLKGDPALTRNDKNIDFDWKTDAAAQGLPKDNFSVRWTRDIEFASGTYRFYAKADDGIRVFLDGERVLNEWRDSDGSKEHQFDSTLEGKHTLRVEYYERGTRAHVKFWWEQQ